MTGKLSFLLLIIGQIILAQSNIQHSPPRNYQPGQKVEITASLTGNMTGLRKAEIHYRKQGQDQFHTDEMFRQGDQFYYNIPAQFAGENGLEYALIFRMENGAVSTPASMPLTSPHFIQPQSEKSNQPGPVLLSPDQGEQFSPGHPVLIAISLFNINQRIRNVRLLVNNEDFTSQAEILEDIITLNIKNSAVGSNQIILKYIDEEGKGRSFRWNFTVAEKESARRRNLNYSGKLRAGANYENINNVSQNIARLDFNSSGGYSNFGYKSRVYMSSLENRSAQPRNRYNFEIINPHFNLTFGDYYPDLSELSLYGRRIRGIEAQAELGFFKLHTVWGYSKRRTSGNISTNPDTLDEGYLFQREGYDFQQQVMGIRPSFQIGEAFELGFSLIKVKDDTSSVDRYINGLNNTAQNIINMATKPQENISIGADFNLHLDNNRIIWESEVGLSQLNRDIYGGAISLQDLDTFFPDDSLENDTITISDDNEIPLESIPVDPRDYSHWFTINENIDPLIPIIPDSSGNIGFEQVWNMPALAVLSKARFNYFRNYIVISYKKIGPKYTSLVNPYLQRDYREIKLMDRIRLWQDKLFFNFSLANRKNNVSVGREQQYDRNTYNLGLMLMPGGRYPRINLNHTQNLRTNQAGIDSVFSANQSIEIIDNRIDMASYRNSFTISQDFELLDLEHNARLNYSIYNTKDRINNRPEDYNFPEFQNAVVRFNLVSHLFQRSRAGFSISNNQAKQDTARTSIFGFGLNFNYLERRDVYSLYGRYNFSQGQGEYDFIKNSLYAGFDYYIFENHQLSCTANYALMIDNKNDKTYNNIRINFSWNLYF